jgi:CDP-4-dehydro-6-deoxyglucose reductase
MSALLSLSRAAQLLGVTRASLQARIRDGSLSAFDGQISLAELQSVFPDFEVENSGAFEKVDDIKKNAFGRRIRERALPSQEVLAQRIFEQSEELEELRRHLQQYHALLQTVLDRLAGKVANATNAPQKLNESLSDEIERRLGEILASESTSNSENSLAIMQNMLKMVSAQVTVRPSGHEFIAEGHDTLLQAGLKAGLRLNYGCGSGTCGLCKTRVVSGSVRQVAPADYVLSEAERTSGHVLSCVCAPVTDVVIETLEASGPEDIPAQEVVATVRAIQPPAQPDGPFLLHLQTPRSNRLRFLAGQSLTLGLRIPAGDLSSTWPIASCPCDDRNLHFHIAAPGGEASDPIANALQAGLIKPGDPINLRGPLGDFTLDPASPRPLVLVCCDTGFGPIKGLIEHALAIDNNDTFGLVWIARENGHYLDNQCRMWASALDHFDYRPLAAAGESRRFAAEALQALGEARSLPYFSEADLYVAGPAEFVDVINQTLDQTHTIKHRLRSCVV